MPFESLDWQTVRAFEEAFSPEAYTPELFEVKCDLVYQHVYENYYGEGRSTYSEMPLAV